MILASLDISCQNAKSQFSNAKLKFVATKNFSVTTGDQPNIFFKLTLID
jgi:hypothetical protein